MTQRTLDGTHRTVIVVGGGQAGLSMSHCLVRRSIDHVVLERDRIAADWRRRRWDSFCLVTPNWQCQLPGFPYAGDDPHGFMRRDEVAEYVEAFAASFGPPVVEGVEVVRVRPRADGPFVVDTTAGTLTAAQVVIAAGPYRLPLVPRMAERLPASVVQLHAAGYRNPDQLPPGAVLVVGSGQSGAQIAEDLHLAGRQVHLATGRAPRTARFYRGRDVVDWLDAMGYYGRSIEDFDDPDDVRSGTNHYVTGRDGGHDIDLRAFALQGMRLYGRLTAIRGDVVTFARDLRANLDHADAVAESIKDTIDEFIASAGIDAPAEARYVPVWEPAGEPGEFALGAAGVTSVVWCTGFGPDLRWVEAPVFDDRGRPVHRRGVTSVPGLYFLGLPWQWTWGSGRFSGVARDAEYLADRVLYGGDTGAAGNVHWIAGLPAASSPADAEWAAPRTVA